MNGFSYGTNYGLGNTSFGKYSDQAAIDYAADLNIPFTAPKTGGFGSRVKNLFGGGNMLGAIIGGGFGLLGSSMAAGTSANIAQAQMAAQADQLKRSIQENREARKAQIGSRIAQNVMDYGPGADLEFGRQLAAAEFDKTRGRDLDRAANIADFRAGVGLKDDPAFREQQQRARKFQLDKITRDRQAAMEGMFGKIV